MVIVEPVSLLVKLNDFSRGYRGLVVLEKCARVYRNLVPAYNEGANLTGGVGGCLVLEF